MKFRSSRGLTGDEVFAAWLRANGLSYTRFREFLAEECLLTATRTEHAVSGLPNYLRSIGLYPELAARATSKHELLMACGLENPRVEDTGLDPNASLNWYLDRVPRESASYLDLLDLARQDAGRLLRAAVREYLYAARAEAGEKVESDE